MHNFKDIILILIIVENNYKIVYDTIKKYINVIMMQKLGEKHEL